METSISNSESEFSPTNLTSLDMSLRRPLGSRLRLYKPPVRYSRSGRLDAIRKALMRGELYLNGLNRWRLREAGKSAIQWTFVDSEHVSSSIAIEEKIARRESGDIRILVAGEQSATETLQLIKLGGESPDLIIIQRDWVNCPEVNISINELVDLCRQRRLTTHIIAAIGSTSATSDPLRSEALQRLFLVNNPLARPIPTVSNIEKQFGACLVDAGFVIEPQKLVANFFLDFAVTLNQNGLPLRLDIEVDGRYWHEELPGQRRTSDHTRDLIVKRFGWRPLRFWDDEIRQNENECVQRVLEEILSGRESVNEIIERGVNE